MRGASSVLLESREAFGLQPSPSTARIEAETVEHVVADHYVPLLQSGYNNPSRDGALTSTERRLVKAAASVNPGKTLYRISIEEIVEYDIFLRLEQSVHVTILYFSVVVKISFGD
jgi:hypothetical protein